MSFLLSLLPTTVSEESVAWESRSLWHRPPDVDSVVREGDRWRFRYLAPGPNRPSELWIDVAHHASSASFVYVYGWCYRSTTRSDRLTEHDYHDVLQRCRDGRPPLTDDHFGTFTMVVYDHITRRIAVIPDRFALSAVYFAATAGRIVVSDSAIAVASTTRAALDGQSLVALFRGMHFPFGRSLFANVNRVMCGCYLDLDLAKHSLAVRRWHPLYRRTLSLSLRDCLEVNGGALRSVAERITSLEPSVIDLTGGNDTRLFAAAVDSVHPGGLPDTVTWRVAGAEGSADVVIARRIAALCGWSLKLLDRYPPADATHEHLQQLAVQADGAFTVDVAFSRIVQETCHSSESECLVGAIGGELLRGFFWRHEMLALGRTSKVNYRALLVYRLYDTNGVDPRQLGADAPSRGEHDDVILDGYRSLGEIGGELQNPYKLDVMYLHKLCYSAGNSQSWLNGFRRIKLPLLASEVCETALVLPWRHRMTRRLVLQLIAQLSPRLSAIPNDKQEPMAALGWESWPSYAAAGARVGSKTLRRIVRGYLGRPAGGIPTKGQVPPASWQTALREGQFLRSAVDPSLIRGILEDVASSQVTPDALKAFYTLLTAELLFNAVPTLSKRVEFSGTPPPLIS